MSDYFTLITGRTTAQAEGMHRGKDSEAYRAATSLVEMNPDDIAHLNLQEGQPVKVHTEAGQVEAVVRVGTLPPGMLFIPMGPLANRLIGPETQGTGMPSFKGLRARVEAT